MLLTRSSSASYKSAVKTSETPTKVLSGVLPDIEANLLSSRDPAMRGLGLKELVAFLRDPSVFFPVDDKMVLLNVLIKSLHDSESFVYLAALHALATLAEQDRVIILPRLLAILSSDSNREVNTNSPISVKDKVMVAEAVGIVIRKIGAPSPSLISSIFRACFAMIRRRAGQREHDLLLSEGVDLRKLKQGAVSSRGSSEDALETADAIILRQSAISLLSDITCKAGWASFPYFEDLLDVCKGIFSLEGSSTQHHVSSRRYLGIAFLALLKCLPCLSLSRIEPRHSLCAM